VTSGAAPTPLPRRLHILQIYRGIGSLLVVLFHLTWYGGQDPPFLRRWMEILRDWVPILDPVGGPLPGFFVFGHSGVDLFITLSGFVMWWGYVEQAGKRDRVLPYLWARFTRIYPTYWVIFALTVAFLWFRPGVNDTALKPEWLLPRFFLYGPTAPPVWQVPPAWTLPYEIALYLVFTVLLLAGRGIFAVLGVFLCAAVFDSWYGRMRLGWHPILLSHMSVEFFLGCLGAAFVRAVRPRLSGWWLVLAILGCLAIGAVDSIGVLRGNHHAFRNFAVPYLVLIVVGAGFELGGERRYPRLLVLLGEASFTIYLAHYYILYEVNGLVGRHPALRGLVGRDLERVVIFVLVIALCLPVWAVVERPIMRALRHRRAPAVE
jgi:peptidoglycan/LPS O-acetylase OafA/YrhL